MARKKAPLRLNDSKVDKYVRVTLRTHLRRIWMISALKSECMNQGRVAIKDIDKGIYIHPFTGLRHQLSTRLLDSGIPSRTKFLYPCAACTKLFIAKDIEIDHIDGIASLFYLSDLPLFVSGLFCSVDRLQRLCIQCHRSKTQD